MKTLLACLLAGAALCALPAAAADGDGFCDGRDIDASVEDVGNVHACYDYGNSNPNYIRVTLCTDLEAPDAGCGWYTLPEPLALVVQEADLLRQTIEDLL
jgi:hypothetical protein